jgi:hypothetical protein
MWKKTKGEIMVMARKKTPKEKDIIDQLLDNIDFKGLSRDEVVGQDGLIKQLTERILQLFLFSFWPIKSIAAYNLSPEGSFTLLKQGTRLCFQRSLFVYPWYQNPLYI